MTNIPNRYLANKPNRIVNIEDTKKYLYEKINRLNNNELYNIFSTIIDDMYNELPAYDQWILCSERLPELSDRFRDNFYLVKLYGVFNDLVEVGYAHFVNRPERTWEIMSEHSEKYWRVISWQKLPESELYKEE